MIVSDNLMVIVKKILVTGPVNNNHESRKMKKKIPIINRTSVCILNSVIYSISNDKSYFFYINPMNLNIFQWIE